MSFLLALLRAVLGDSVTCWPSRMIEPSRCGLYLTFLGLCVRSNSENLSTLSGNVKGFLWSPSSGDAAKEMRLQISHSYARNSPFTYLHQHARKGMALASSLDGTNNLYKS